MSRHKEEDWVQYVLKPVIEGMVDKDKYEVRAPFRLLRFVSFNKYDEENDKFICERDDIKNNDFSKSFNVDLCILEKDNGYLIPRVVIEVKLNNINTHDPIAYNQKNGLHKNLYPGLRYGLLVGNYEPKTFDIPERMMTHGEYFDFMAVFKENEISNKGFIEEKRQVMQDIINDNLKIAATLEKYIVNDKGRDNCWCVSRNIEFKQCEKN